MSNFEHVLVSGKNVIDKISTFMEIEQLSFSKELQYSFDEFKQKLSKEGTFVLYRQKNNVIEAFAIFTEKDEDALENGVYLDTLVVKEKGKGYGKKMDQVLCKSLENLGYTSISLRTEEIPTKEGINLVKWYTKLGYQAIGKDERGVLMRKFLNINHVSKSFALEAAI